MIKLFDSLETFRVPVGVQSLNVLLIRHLSGARGTFCVLSWKRIKISLVCIRLINPHRIYKVFKKSTKLTLPRFTLRHNRIHENGGRHLLPSRTGEFRTAVKLTSNPTPWCSVYIYCIHEHWPNAKLFTSFIFLAAWYQNLPIYESERLENTILLFESIIIRAV